MKFRALIILIYPDHSFALYSSLLNERVNFNYNDHVSKVHSYYEFNQETRSFSYYRNHYKKFSKKSILTHTEDFFTNDKYLIDLNTFNSVLISLKNRFRKFQSMRSGTKIFRIIKYYESGEIEYESEEIKKIERN